MRIFIFAEAREDLEQIYNFYALQNVRAAIKIHNGILDDIELLQSNPYIGPILSKRGNYYIRALLCRTRKHKIIYYIVDDEIRITQIWDCRRNPQDLYF